MSTAPESGTAAYLQIDFLERKVAELEAQLAAKGEPAGFYSAELTVAMATIKRQAKCITQLEAASQAAPVGICKVCAEDLELPQAMSDEIESLRVQLAKSQRYAKRLWDVLNIAKENYSNFEPNWEIIAAALISAQPKENGNEY